MTVVPFLKSKLPDGDQQIDFPENQVAQVRLSPQRLNDIGHVREVSIQLSLSNRDYRLLVFAHKSTSMRVYAFHTIETIVSVYLFSVDEISM